MPLRPRFRSLRIASTTTMTRHPSLDTLRSHPSTPCPHDIPLLFRHLSQRILHILSLKHILGPPAILIKEIVLQGINGGNSLIRVVFEKFGKEVEAIDGFSVIFYVPFFEIVGVLFE